MVVYIFEFSLQSIKALRCNGTFPWTFWSPLVQLYVNVCDVVCSLVQWRKSVKSWRLRMCFRRLLCVRIEIDQPAPVRELLSNNSLFVGQLYGDKSLALRARDLIFFTTDLQTVNYYSTIHCWSWSISYFCDKYILFYMLFCTDGHMVEWLICQMYYPLEI